MTTDTHSPRILPASTCIAAFSTVSMLLCLGWALCSAGMGV